MVENDIIPSWLTSWIAWRNYYSDHGKEPFGILKREFGLDRLPTQSEFLIQHGGDCPFCHDDAIKRNSHLGVVYCICKVLGQIQKLEIRHEDIRTKVDDATLDEMTFPRQMGGEYVRTLKNAISIANDFIRSPDYWLFINGYFGSGKTHILRAINAAFRPMSLYVSARDLEQNTHKLRKEDALDFFYDVLINAPILIFDDIGMEYGGPLVKSIIEKVVDARYERWPDYPLIIATNLTEKTLPTVVPRAADRIFDRNKTKVITIVTDQSFRKVNPEFRQ